MWKFNGDFHNVKLQINLLLRNKLGKDDNNPRLQRKGNKIDKVSPTLFTWLGLREHQNYTEQSRMKGDYQSATNTQTPKRVDRHCTLLLSRHFFFFFKDFLALS